MEALRKKLPPLGQTAYRQRVRAVLKTTKAQNAAKFWLIEFKRTCKKVVDKGGAASGR